MGRSIASLDLFFFFDKDFPHLNGLVSKWRHDLEESSLGKV